MLQRLARFLLVAALVVAGQGALEHPLAHLGTALQAHESVATGEGHSQDVAHACEFCIAASGIGALADSKAGSVDLANGAVRATARPARADLPGSPLAYRSQAP